MNIAKANRLVAEFMRAHEAFVNRGGGDPSDIEYKELQFRAAKSKLQRTLVMSSEMQLYDMVADEATQVEIQREAAFASKYKLYIHQAGRSIVRICKLKRDQITIYENLLHVTDEHREGLSADALERDNDDVNGNGTESTET